MLLEWGEANSASMVETRERKSKGGFMAFLALGVIRVVLPTNTWYPHLQLVVAL
jgi:hypothetical protein